MDEFFCFAVRFMFAALLLPVGSAAAQTVEVRNGGTVQVQNGGTWTLEGGTMDLGPAGSTVRLDEQGGGRVGGGVLTATRTLSSPSSANVAGLGAVLSTSADLGAVTVTRGHAVQTAPNGNASIRRYYDLVPSQKNSSLDATLTLHYADAELNGRAESSLEFFKSTDDGSTWAEAGADQRDATANTVTLSGIASLSRWTLGSADQPLPVEMAGFEGTTTEDGVRLTWQTASETGNAGFRVQRRASEGEWEQVGRVDGSGTTTTNQSYRFVDEDLPYAADRLTYRLKQVDTEGTTAFSDPVTIGRAVQEVELLRTFPNPARSHATVRFAVPEGPAAEDVTLRLYDVLGREVRTAATQAEAGRHEVQVPTHDLASGVYFLRLQAAEHIRTQKLTVVR
jgi:hypothetical protein